MKKLIIFAIGLIAMSATAQENNVWRLGAQIGISANKAKYAGGMENANARFQQNNFGAPTLNFVARYDYNNHWMGMTGIGFNSIGFNYALAENYSLLNYKDRFSGIKSNFGTVEIPAMVFYKFNFNCKNTRWIVGGGFVSTLIGKQSATKDYSKTPEGGSTNYLKSESSTNGGGYELLRWSIGREKMYKNGSILQASIIMNVGFKTIANSTVNYTVDNQSYQHTFSNKGSFVGFRLAYFLKPFASKKLKKESQSIK